MNEPPSDAPPTVTVLHDAGEGPPPGLEALEPEARLVLTSDREALFAALPDTDVLLVTDFRSPWVREGWVRAERLRWVHATSAGVDMLLFPESCASEVIITNARGIFDRAIAETVIGQILMFAKDFLGSLRLKSEHRWQHRDTERVQGERLLVVGAGSIGRQIARLARAIGLQVEGIASRAREDRDFDAVHAQQDLHERLSMADYVVAVAPLTDSTRGMFDAAAFHAMKPSARFINVGRGPLVRTDDLLAALQREEIAGAALDVFEEEPLPPEHPLWDLPQVFISAHMAGDFIGWREALIQQFLENFRRWRSGQPLENQVDKARGYVPAKEG